MGKECVIGILCLEFAEILGICCVSSKRPPSNGFHIYLINKKETLRRKDILNDPYSSKMEDDKDICQISE